MKYYFLIFHIKCNNLVVLFARAPQSKPQRALEAGMAMVVYHDRCFTTDTEINTNSDVIVNNTKGVYSAYTNAKYTHPLNIIS